MCCTPLLGLYPGIDTATIILAIQAVFLAEIHRLPEAVPLAESLCEKGDPILCPFLSSDLLQHVHVLVRADEQGRREYRDLKVGCLVRGGVEQDPETSGAPEATRGLVPELPSRRQPPLGLVRPDNQLEVFDKR